VSDSSSSDEPDEGPAADERTTVPTSATPVGVETRRLRAAIETRIFGAATTAAPARIGRFVVLDRLGEGGMGTVWAAWDPELDRRVAIKVTRRRIDRARSVARMRREARALARLDHPNVVTVHEVDVIDDHLYIAMELVRGGTLTTWCEDHPAGEPGRFAELLPLAIQAARGLAAVHGAGMVHRDLKPSNMLVDEGGRLCLTDFGLARLGDARATGEPETSERGSADEGEPVDPAGSLTRAGEVLGTPAYMAPEQLEGRADALADQFSLCATLWEAAYGVRPFAGLTPLARLEAIAEGRPTLPATAHAVPAWFRGVLRRGLMQEPAQRWPDVLALLRALERGRDRRRDRWRVVAGVVALAGVAAWGAWVRMEPGLWCGAGGDALAPAWGPDQRAAIAVHHEPAMVAALDAYGEAWVAAYTETCHAYAEAAPDHRGDAPLQAGSERLGCLADAREQLATVTDELATTRADDHPALVRALPALADCEGREVVAATPRDAARIAAAPVIGRARVLLAAGRLEAAGQLLDGSNALDLTSDAVAGSVEELRAGIDAARGEHEDAERRAARALGLAERVGDREAALRAWLRLHAAAVAQGHDERARLCATRAASLARRGAPASLEDAAQQAAAVTPTAPLGS
jgi:eukaryotic-like serine/threonine-protein kinase